MRVLPPRTALLMAAACLRHVASSAVGFLVIPLVAHLLGAEALAAWALLGTSAFVLGVSDLGLSAAVQRAAARREDASARELVGVSLLSVAVVAGPLAMACWLLVLDFPQDPSAARDLHLAAGPTLLAGAVQAWGFPFRAWLVGRGQLPSLMRARLASASIQITLTTLGLLQMPRLAVVGLALLAAALVEVTLNVRAARRVDGAIPLRPSLASSWGVVWSALRHGSAALAVAMGGLAAVRLDLALLAHHAPIVAVAAYAVASRAVDQSFTMAKQVSTALLPRLAQDSTRDDAILTGTRVLGGLVAVGMAALCLPGQPLLRWWAGAVASDPAMLPALLLLAMGATIAASHETVASALMVGGVDGWDAARPLVAGYVLNFLVSATFVAGWGVWAVAGGTLLGNALTSALLWWRADRRLGWGARRAWRALLPVGFAATAAIAVALPLSLQVEGPPTTLLGVALTMAVGLASGHWSARRVG